MIPAIDAHKFHIRSALGQHNRLIGALSNQEPVILIALDYEYLLPTREP